MNKEQDTILEALEEGVVVCDAKLFITSINAVASKLFGLPKKQLLGKNLSEHSGALVDKCKVLLQFCFAHNSPVTDSITLTKNHAHCLYLDVIVLPKEQDGGAVLILQDKSNHHKALEVGKDFVANASHELRTPITIIKGFAETLQDMPELPADMIADITKKIVRNCERMDSLIRSLLMLADIENLPKSRFQEIDVITLIEQAEQRLRVKYQEATVVITREGNDFLVGAEPDLLELAFTNLLDNAAKYSNRAIRIVVHIKRTAEEVNVTIADEGIGIPQEDLPHIFERFYTVNKAHSRRLGGAGLGLSIVKTIIEKHAGEISAASVVGTGTTFTLTLPSYTG